MKFLSTLKAKRRQRIKDSIAGNRSGMLSVMSETLDKKKQCPLLLGEPCIGAFCSKFEEFETRYIDDHGKEKVNKFWRCMDLQAPMFQVETNNKLQAVIKELQLLRTDLKRLLENKE